MVLRCLPSYPVSGSYDIQIAISLLFALVGMDVKHILKGKLGQDR